MPGIAWIGILLLVFSLLVTIAIATPTSAPGIEAPSSVLSQPIVAHSEAVGANLGVFHDSARRYAAANPSFLGTLGVSDLSAYLPNGYNALGPWEASVQSTSVTSYAGGALASNLSPYEVAVGLAAYGNFQGYAGFVNGAGLIEVPIPQSGSLNSSTPSSTVASPVSGLSVGTPIWTSSR